MRWEKSGEWLKREGERNERKKERRKKNRFLQRETGVGQTVEQGGNGKKEESGSLSGFLVVDEDREGKKESRRMDDPAEN
jgi:hypothetical protein